jgi:hypothetical protein
VCGDVLKCHKKAGPYLGKRLQTARLSHSNEYHWLMQKTGKVFHRSCYGKKAGLSGDFLRYNPA